MWTWATTALTLLVFQLLLIVVIVLQYKSIITLIHVLTNYKFLEVYRISWPVP
ncbi:hypothetical protein C0J52_01120 [Blattella germanica]|nr:hypothetical protein C0J52_01120 [Blattella germanica]